MVECTALEMRHTGNRIGGSNPSLSASNITYIIDMNGIFSLVHSLIPQLVPQCDINSGVGSRIAG